MGFVEKGLEREMDEGRSREESVERIACRWSEVEIRESIKCGS